MHQEVLAEAPVDAKPTASSLGNPTSRVTSVSTVKAGSSDDHVLRDPAIVSVSTSPARGRSTKYVPERTQERSDHSLGSSTSSDLRATAPEFVPQVLAPAPAQPTNSAMPVDPFSPEQYGMPAWMYQMYAVNIQQAMAPKKRGRKRGNSSPKKAVPPSSGAENAEREPFIAQLEEVARAAAVRHGKEPQDTSGSPFQTTPTRNRQPRNAGNGLYDTIGRGRGRQAGVPIDATMPFPTPVPPTGRQDNPGYSTIKREPTCGIYNIEQAAEWGGGFCNNCRPDH
ncbi:hypothetical protein K458DRAFT_425179 [Lentithecium fluviatile CBS 122367]|uniref:Uncharacterized protein n=1 Tax=Lentithecium fluviatile CBS 122367 TaxID=1168545 RepID=A0A6G1ID86_9PLEO|nr:hypothetical protein K458DRAFT_425179 [Lentithecium fluviatile CBS 122367]